MTRPTALITGISGQDGAYLSKLLLEKGYRVVGAMRRTSTKNLSRLDELGIGERVEIVDIELLEFSNIFNLVREIRPTEIYNLGAQSFVGLSFKEPIFTSDVDGLSVTRLLECIRMVDPGIRFYQASTSEMFGKVRETPQRETTPFHPRSPYGVAKAYAHYMTVNYRESYGLHASSGILFNHESPLRGEEFVTRKITRGIAAIVKKGAPAIELGNTHARRDWGHARDYVEGMWRMVQSPAADDYVLATGETRSVEEFASLAAEGAGIAIEWHGEGVERHARDRRNGRLIIKTSPEFFRPAEVDVLMGDAGKAKALLGWKPSTSFEALVEEMIKADLDRTN